MEGDFKYDDDAAMASGGSKIGQGVHKVKITDVVPAKGGDSDFAIKRGAKSVFYGARVIFGMTDEQGNERTISGFFNFGIWFPKETTQFLKAVGMNTKGGRTELMTGKDKAKYLIGMELQITVGAHQETDYQTARRQDANRTNPGSAPIPFKGYVVNEYNGKSSIDSDVTGYFPLNERADYDAAFEAQIRKEFAEGGEESDGGMAMEETTPAPVAPTEKLKF